MNSGSTCENVPSHVEDLFIQNRQLRWEAFTPERISYVSKEIERFYVPSVGIQASELCRILYGYYPTRKMYEGICYHLFNLVATKDGKGHVFFIKKSEVGVSAFPVISSIWHNLDTAVEEEGGSSELSEIRDSLENQWNEEDIETNKNTLSLVLSSMLNVCSKLSRLLGRIS